MKGNIRKRSKNGGWQITIWTGTKPDGKPQRHYETVRGRKSDAQRRLRELLTNIDKGAYTPPSHITVAELLNQWLVGYCKAHCSPRTQEGYESIIRNHLVPALGHIKLEELKVCSIQAFYGSACEQELTNRTVSHFHRVLSQALKWAAKLGYLSKNPAESADPPKAQHKTMNTLSEFEAAVLLEKARDSFCYPVIYTAISTGMRRNELLGLRWRDIDLYGLSISVSQTLYKGKGKVEFREPKTGYSRRRISMTPKLALYLGEYKREREQLFEERGTPITLDDLVFTNDDGKCIDPSTVSHNFGRISRSMGLNIRFHDLRHTCASLMLSKGVHPKIVSEMLGHSTVAITLDIYSHVTPGLQEAAAKSLDALLPPGLVGAAAERHGLVV